MKKIAPILVFLVGFVYAESPAQKFPIGAFNGGLNSNYAGMTIGNNEVQDALNVYFDGTYPVQKREGYTLCGSTDSVSIDSSWSYSDASNNGWFIIRKPTKIIASNQGCSFTVTIATVSALDTVNAVNAFGYIYFVDRTNKVYSWNGTSTTYVANSPAGNLIAEFRGRLWVSGLAHPYGNQLYSSGYLDGSNWTVGSLATSPVVLTLGLNDSYDNITSIFSGYNDSMQIFKNLSIYGLYGFDQTDFEARILNREVGCVDNRSVQPFMGGMVFASKRGIEFFDGVTVQTPPISDKVNNLINNNSITPAVEASWTQTTQADFQSGGVLPANQVSTSLIPDSVTISSFSVTESSTQFANGTFSNTNLVGGLVYISTSSNTGNPSNNSFESGAYGSVPTNWTSTIVGSGSTYVLQSSSGSLTTCVNLYSGMVGQYFAEPASGVAAASAKLIVQILDSGSGAELQSSTITATTKNCNFAKQSITISPANIGTSVKLNFYQTDAANRIVYIKTTNAFTLNNNLFFYMAVADNGASFNFIALDNVMSMSTGTYTSQAYNTGFTSSTFQVTAFSATADTSQPQFVLQTSTSATGAWRNLLTSVGANAVGNQYVRYIASFTVTSSDNLQSSLSSVSIISRSSGTYYSAVKNSPSLTSFAYLAVNSQNNGGSHTFYMRSSTSTFSVLSATPSWTAQSANATISISTGTYFQVRDDFVITAATQTPTLNDFAVSWREGTPRQPMASLVAGKRYYIAFSTTTSVNKNTGILVLSRGPVWSFWSIPAGSLLAHRGSYYATNNSDNGAVYTLFSGTSDNGSSINSYIKTKDFSLNDDMTQDKVLYSIYIVFNSLGSTNLDTKYFLDGQSTQYSLSSVAQNEDSGIVSMQLNFPLSLATPTFGKTVAFKFGSNDTESSFNFYGGVLNYHARATQ